MNSHGTFSQSSKQAWRNPWVIGWLALLVLVVGVNVGFITIAVITNPGLVEEDYYERGRQHEREFLREREARSQLAWGTRIQTPDAIVAGRRASYHLTVVDRVGQPLSGAAIVAHAYRPSDASADFMTNFEEIAPGVYRGDIAFPLKGIWDLKVAISRDNESLEVSRRLNVGAR